MMMRSMSNKLFTATMFIFALYLLAWYKHSAAPFTHVQNTTTETTTNNNTSQNTVRIQKNNTVVLPYVVVHIDLKGAPPKLSYLESLLPMLKRHGVNALMMEYEDMFPYEGKLVNISAKNCYNRPELRRFLKKAVESDFEIIPLIQTFGHLEHVLKLAEFRHLREVPVFPDSLCPSKIESRALIKLMLNQVIYFHKATAPLKSIHVGCDDVYYMNKCEQCASKQLPDIDLFMQHVRFISEYFQESNPTTNVLIWDDMMRSLKPIDWNNIDFFNNIEPVYWNYGPSVNVTHLNLLNYHKKFKGIWIASAFKGADGKMATTPNLKKRFMNHFSWMNFIKNYQFGGEGKYFIFKGIILTGWSRYSHMDPLCELLPVALPSLLLNLLLVKKYLTGIIDDDAANADIGSFFIKYIDEDFAKSLECNNSIDIYHLNIQHCNFESKQTYELTKQHNNLKNVLYNYVYNDTALSSIEYYAVRKFINVNNVLDHLDRCNTTLKDLVNVEIKLNHVLKKYYSHDVIDEYVNYKTYSAKNKLKNTLNALQRYAPTLVWDRNPIDANVFGLQV